MCGGVAAELGRKLNGTTSSARITAHAYPDTRFFQRRANIAPFMRATTWKHLIHSGSCVVYPRTLTLSAFDRLDRRFIDAVQPSERSDRGVSCSCLFAARRRTTPRSFAFLNHLPPRLQVLRHSAKSQSASHDP